ncbi:MAG: hypothetical protein K0R02_308 [Rickettsiaceae bacterium]|jgi:hypothetical protein|nr:hypothetical protein [Rickettsiaceae bacterium]
MLSSNKASYKYFKKIISKNIDSAEGILGAHSGSEVFSEIYKNDFFAITFADNTSALYSFNPTNQLCENGGLEFKNLETLKNVFNLTPGLAAKIEDKRLIVISDEGIRAEGMLAEKLGLCGTVHFSDE